MKKLLLSTLVLIIAALSVMSVSAAANVSSAVVSLEDKNCVVTHDNADINGIINAINELGFTASL